MTKMTEKQIRARLREIQKELEPIEAKLTELLDEDRTDYAQGIIDKLFAEFTKGRRWLQRMNKLVHEKLYVFAPSGRRRSLYAVLMGIKSIVAQQVRRGSNAPLQGFASEIGVKASRQVMTSYYDFAPEIKRVLGLARSYDHTIRFNRVVHDALYYAVPYAMVLPFLHVLQYEATYGITKAFEDEFGIKFTIEPEIEIEIASRDDQSYKWDWALPSLAEIIRKALTDMKDLGRLESSVESVMAEIFEPWTNPETRRMLQDHYPLLGVSNLDKQIKNAAKLAVKV